MPKISIIIPIYNVEKYLKKCLDSVINQTFQDTEIILVNDGSPDNSQIIVNEYKKKYPKKIKFYIKENGGLSSARNYGLKYAKGEYILFIDSDDYIDCTMVEKLYSSIEKNHSDIAMCDFIKVYENKTKKDYVKTFYGDEYDKKNFLMSSPGVCIKLVKRKIIKDNKIKFMENVWFEDVAFSLKLILMSSKISYVNEGLYYYFKHKSSIMHSSNVLKNQDLILDFDDAISFFKQKNMYEKYKQEIEFHCIDRMYLSGITRLLKINGDKKEIKGMIEKYIQYIIKTFPNYKKNQYLHELAIERKIIYNLVNLRMFSLIKTILKLKEKLL